MREEEFSETRIGEFFNMLHRFVQERIRQNQFAAELTRNQTLILVNLQLPVKDRIRSAGDLWPMPWDHEEHVQIADPDSQREQIRQLIRNLPNRDGKESI